MFRVSSITGAFIHLLDLTASSKYIALLTLLTIISIIIFSIRRPPKVFLLDFACYKPAESQKCTKELVVERSRLYMNFNEDTLEFMGKVLERSGLGKSTYLPEALLNEPPTPCLEMARGEFEAVVFGTIDQLLNKTGVKGKDIGILVVNCCIFNPVPSLSSMIVNRYRLRHNVRSFSVGGMGCSAGLAAINLAKQLLQVHQNSYALVVSTENITENAYNGEDRSMLLVNCIFRVGGAAILLSNRPSDRRSSKYQLIHTVHSHTASSDLSYNCIFQEEDKDGHVGVTINKNLMVVAIKTIEYHLHALGKLVLPISEQFHFLVNYLIRYFHVAKIRPYTPNFRLAFDHFLPHVGAKPVLDELERNLEFSETQMEASRMTLYRFGNTSSSSVWYELAYAEAMGRIKRGDRVWQIAFGSGFKCNSAIWRAMRTVDCEEANPWSDEIGDYPVDLHNIGVFLPYFEPSKKACLG